MGSTDDRSDSHSPGAAPPRSTRPRRLAASWFRRVLKILVLSIGGLLVVLYFLQGRLIFPGAASQGAEAAQVAPRNGAELTTLTTDSGDSVAALFGPALDSDGRPIADAASRPAVIYFYGNAMCLAYCDAEFDRFRRLGVNVIIPDYLGYGLSGGSASERGCRATADACYAELRRRGFPAARIVAAGWSLGGAVAIDLAHRRSVGGLIAFCAFTSIQDMARTIIPVRLPQWAFPHRFENLRKIADVHCPILLGHGRRDSIIPFWMFERLSAAAGPNAAQIVVDDADHNDFFEVGGKKLTAAIAAFLARLQP